VSAASTSQVRDVPPATSGASINDPRGRLGTSAFDTPSIRIASRRRVDIPLGTSIVEMQEHVNGLQKNLDTLRKLKGALGG